MPADISYAQGKAVSTPPVTAQPPPLQPREIKLGDGRVLAYEISKEPSSFPISRPDVNRGTILYHPNGGFELWGVWNGTQFSYRHLHNVDGSVLGDMLTLAKDAYAVRLANHPAGIIKDGANVGGVDFDLGSSDFYEGPTPTQPWEKLNEKERVLLIFKGWERTLNIGAVKAEAERLKTPKALLRKSLDDFIVK